MSCLEELLKKSNGILSEEEAFNILSQLDDEINSGRLGPDLNGKSLIQDELNLELRSAIQEKRRKMLTVIKREQAIGQVNRFLKETGDINKGIESLLVGRPEDITGARRSVESLKKTLENEFKGGFVTELEGEGLWKAFQKSENDGDIVAELFNLSKTDNKGGPVTKNKEAFAIAKSIRKYQEASVARQNMAGADIQWRDDFIFSQTHDQHKIRTSGRDEWIKFIAPLLDEEKTFGTLTTDARLNFLENSFNGLSTGVHTLPEALKDASLPSKKGRGGLAKSLGKQRKLIFKDAESFMKYQEAFGRGNLQDNILRSLDRAATNVALLEILGPDPENMLFGSNGIFDQLRNRNPEQNVNLKKINDPGKGLAKQWMDKLTGRANITGAPLIASVGAMARSFEVATKLGGVLLTSFSDIPGKVADLRYQGVPWEQALFSPFKDAFKATVKDSTFKQIAKAFGYAGDGLLGEFRYEMNMESPSVNMFTKGWESTMHWATKLNGLSAWTDAQKTGNLHMISSFLGQNAESSYDNLIPELKRSLSLYDIEPNEWELMRMQVSEIEGDKFLLPDKFLEIDNASIRATFGEELSDSAVQRIKNDLGLKLRNMAVDRTDVGILTPGVKQQTFLENLGGASDRSNTTGELIFQVKKLLTQFKSFPLAYMDETIGREVYGRGHRDFKSYITSSQAVKTAGLITSTTLVAYMVMNFKSFAKGQTGIALFKEDRQIDLNVLTRAMMLGGGLGLYGDFLLGEHDRFGQTLSKSLMGPGISKIDDLRSIMFKMQSGNFDKAQEEALKLALRNIPFTNLFYTKAAFDYFIVDNIMESINPGYKKKKAKKLKENFNQENWFNPMMDEILN